MARTQNIQWSLPAWFVALQSISHKVAVASLSLSPLVTDPAASRPPGERECGGLSLSPLVTDPAASRSLGEREEVHRFSV